MGLIWDDDVERLTFEDGEWVDLKRELSSGDEDAIYEALYTASVTPGDQSDERVRVSFRVTAMNRARVRRSLVAWSFTRNGEPVPVDDANVDRLDRETYELIVAKVDELNPFEVRKKKATSTNSQPSSVASATTRRRR